MNGNIIMPAARRPPAARKTSPRAATAPSAASAPPPRTLGQDDTSLFSQAYAQIEARIASLELAPGQVVSENMLSTLLGLGRTPVREALQQLSREGLVTIMPKRGIVVSGIDVRKQLRLLEVRRHVEQCVVSLASKRADPLQRDRFEKIAQEMDAVIAANDGEAFLALDSEFNALLLAAARNEYATSTMRMMQGLSRRFWFAHWRTVADLPETVRLHAAIARAVARGDEAGATAGLDRLIDNVEAFTRATLDALPAY